VLECESWRTQDGDLPIAEIMADFMRQMCARWDVGGEYLF
jgi:hypothetical protein